LSPERIAKERLKIIRGLERGERESKGDVRDSLREQPRWGVGKVCAKDDRCVEFAVSDFLAACDFDSPQREIFRGRETVVINFRPRPGATFSKSTAYMSQLEGRVWIDLADKVVVRLAAWPRGGSLGQPGDAPLEIRAPLVFEQARTLEGIWLFSFMRINGFDYRELFPGVAVDYTFETFDYVHFKTEAGPARLDSPLERR
jgi:hypothetical protein